MLNLGRLADITTDGTRMVAQSGARIIDASQEALSHSLTGLELRAAFQVLSAGRYL